MKANNIIGNTYGLLTVVGRAGNSKQRKAMWHCKCSCGNDKLLASSSYDLMRGKVKSCGCIKSAALKGVNTKHGKSRTRLYNIHQSMIARCNKPNSPTYRNYGERGIKVCEEWQGKNGFMSFIAWAETNGYSPSLTIDRIDVNGNYEPSNCRWATYEEQENNRGNNRIVNYQGKSLTLSTLAKTIGISSSTLSSRIKHGWAESEWDMPTDLNNKNIRRNLNV